MFILLYLSLHVHHSWIDYTGTVTINNVLWFAVDVGERHWVNQRTCSLVRRGALRLREAECYLGMCICLPCFVYTTSLLKVGSLLKIYILGYLWNHICGGPVFITFKLISKVFNVRIVLIWVYDDKVYMKMLLFCRKDRLSCLRASFESCVQTLSISEWDTMDEDFLHSYRCLFLYNNVLASIRFHWLMDTDCTKQTYLKYSDGNEIVKKIL